MNEYKRTRVEEFVDMNKKVRLSIQVPDDWNSGTASGTYSNINWRFYSVVAVNNEANAFFIVTTAPPLSGLLVPPGEAIGITSRLISNHFTLKDEYDVMLQDGSHGHAYSISASSDQLSNAQSILPIDKDIDAILALLT